MSRSALWPILLAGLLHLSACSERVAPSATAPTLTPMASIGSAIPTSTEPLGGTRQPIQTVSEPIATHNQMTFDSQLISQPECQLIGDWYRCEDLNLGISFEYSKDWGEFSAEIAPGDVALQGGYAGFYYYYHFPSNRIGADGASSDFIGHLMPYLGFFHRTPEEVCADREASASNRVFLDCEVAQENVIIVAIYPAADMYCFPYAASIMEPVVEVMVDLPANTMATGFRFSGWLLSTEARTQLGDRVDKELGAHTFQPLPERQNCDSESMRQLDEWIEGFIAELEAGHLDDETVQTLHAFHHLAESIRIVR